MQMEFTDYAQALTSIVQLLQSSEAMRSQPEDVRTVAIRKVWRAVDTTRMFFASVRAESDESRRRQRLEEPNPQLNQLWSDAALALMVLDPELANRLRFKAEFWSNPAGWQDVPGINIEIDQIAEAARGLMAPHAELPAPSSHTLDPTKDTERLDVFISHASEDKDVIATPLANELRHRGRGVWYDDFRLRLGDNLRLEIDKGLALCRYAVVILSPAYVAKAWTNLEFDGIRALEVEKRQRILPIRHGLTQEAVTSFSPTLSGRLSLDSSIGIERVVEAVTRVLDSGAGSPNEGRQGNH